MKHVPLSEQIKVKRNGLEWSQQKLAEVAGLSIDTVRGIESGRNTNPTLFVLRALNKALDLKFEI